MHSIRIQSHPAVERFQQQLEIVDLIDTDSIGAIQSKINECVEKDPGALEADPIVMEVDEEEQKLVIVDKKDSKKKAEEMGMSMDEYFRYTFEHCSEGHFNNEL